MEVAFSVDIPFWPQLPLLNPFEDMYVQFSENFPGASVSPDGRRLSFDSNRFYEELPAFAERLADPATFAPSEKYSLAFRRFLEHDLSGFPAVKGHVIGPISFGLQVVDESKKPIIYSDEVRTLLFEFARSKITAQYEALRAKNPVSIVFIDEPGLELIFNSTSGYTNEAAREDLAALLAGVPSPKTVHLCGNPDWDFLLAADIDLLSFNAYAHGETILRYGRLVDFMRRGGLVAWGIVPVGEELLAVETKETLLARLETLWRGLAERSGGELGVERIARQSFLAPATCNLIGPSPVDVVERAYDILVRLATTVQARYCR